MENPEPINPDLQTALVEIGKIVKKYNLGAHVSVHDRVDGEHKTFLPTWAMATFIERPDGGLKLHMKLDVIAKDGHDSLNLFCGMRIISYKAAAIFENVGRALHRHLSPETYAEHQDTVPVVGGGDETQPNG